MLTYIKNRPFISSPPNWLFPLKSPLLYLLTEPHNFYKAAGYIKKKFEANCLMVKSEPQGIWRIKEHCEDCVPRTSLPCRLWSCHPHSSQHSHAKPLCDQCSFCQVHHAIKQRSIPKDVTESPSFGESASSWSHDRSPGSRPDSAIGHQSDLGKVTLFFSHWYASLIVTKRVGEGKDGSQVTSRYLRDGNYPQNTSLYAQTHTPTHIPLGGTMQTSPIYHRSTKPKHSLRPFCLACSSLLRLKFICQWNRNLCSFQLERCRSSHNSAKCYF